MTRRRPLQLVAILVVSLLAFAASRSAHAQAPPCRPCAGVTVTDPTVAVAALQQAPRVADDARLYVRWRQDATTAWDPGAAKAVADAGGTPWLELVFHTPAPLVEHAADLERELAGLASVARNAGPLAHFEIGWEPQ